MTGRNAYRGRHHKLSAFVVLTAVAVVGTTGLAGISSNDPTLAIDDEELAAVAPEGWTGEVDGPFEPEMLGFTWEGGEVATLEVRAVTAEGTTDWVEVHGNPSEGPDTDSPEYHATVSAGPVWLGHDAEDIEVRVVEGEPIELVSHAIDSEPPAVGVFGIDSAGALPASPDIISRAQWGANESEPYTQPGCESGPVTASGGLTNAIVHHSASTNDYGPADSAAQIRGIQLFHMRTNGWCDIAYNFVIDRFGQIFEGRKGGINRAIVGGHASGFNTGSTGITLLGDFSSASVPTASYNALVRLLSWKLAFHGIDPLGWTTRTVGANTSAKWPEGTLVTLSNIGAHRDTNQTGCPGNAGYAILGRLRADVAAGAAVAPDVRLMCDWNGDGVDSPGAFQNGVWWLRNSNDEGGAQGVFRYGAPGDTPLCGDWNGDGADSFGVYRGGVWLLSDNNATANRVFRYADPGEYAVTGDWNGDGVDTVGVVRSAGWFLTDVNADSFASTIVKYGDPAGDVPVVGDWNGDGRDTVGVVRGGTWYLRNSNVNGFAEMVIPYGGTRDRPVPGDYNADGHDSLGIARGAYFFVRNDLVSGNAQLNFWF